MAHNIENNMIAYKNETPWHGLGVNVSANATGAEMLIAAGLNWKVQRRALAMSKVVTDAAGNMAIDRSEMLTSPLSSYRAIVRSDNDSVFQISTDRYHLVQNEQVIDLFREYCEAGHASMETVGGLNNGAKVWALARLNGGSTTTIGGNDELRGYVLMATSHDGSLRTIAKTTQVRVVCWNTLSAALFSGNGKLKNQAGTFQMKHSTKWTAERAAEAKETLGIAMEQIQATNVLSEKLANVKIDHSDWLSFMGRLMGGDDKVLDPKTADLTNMASDIQNATLTSPGAMLKSAKGTLWGAVNGVTYYADHLRGRTQDSRLASAWFGDSDVLKRTAFAVAAEMAGVSA